MVNGYYERMVYCPRGIFLFLLLEGENNYWKLKELSDVNPSSHCVRIVAGNGIRCLNGDSLCSLVRFPLSTVRKCLRNSMFIFSYFVGGTDTREIRSCLYRVTRHWRQLFNILYKYLYHF